MYAGRKGGSGTSSSTKRVIVKSALERILEEPSPSRPSHEPPSKLRTSEVDLGAGDHTINGGAPSSPVSSSSSLTTQEKAPPSQSTPRCQTLDDTVAVHSLVSGEDKENVVEFSRGDRANDVGENPMSRRNFFTVTYAREAPKTPRNHDGIMGGGVVTEGHGTAFHSVADDKAENTEVPSSFLMPPASATSQSLPYQKHSDRFPCGGSEVESIGDHRHHHYYVDAEVEEAPSTLLFLSPSSRPSEERLAERGCYPSNSHRYKNVDGIKVSSPRPSEARGAERSLFSTSPPPPQHSKKLYSDDGEGESVAEDVRDEGDQGVSGKGHPRGVDTNIRLVSNTRSKVDMKDETPVEQLIAAAVHEYASYRDAEEAEALNEIREEIDIQNTRYQSLLGLNQSMAKENEAMRAERDRLLSDVERQQNQIGELECQLSKQCEQLEMALQKQQSSPSPPSGSDEIVELEKMWKQEVILFHQAETALIKERDELRDMITQQQSTILSLEHDCREKEKALHESTLSRQQMEAEQQDIIQKMKALGSYMDSVEVMLKEREATVSELEGKLRECEKQKRAGLKEIKEQTNMQQQSISAQLSELRASLDTQTSEVRKKMHRIAVLEKEKKFLQNELDQWRKIPEAMQDQQSTLHRSMVVLSRECHSQWKLFANTTLSKLSNATSSTSDQQFAVSALPQLKELVEELNEEAEAAGAPFLKGGLRDLWKSAADGSPTSAAPLPPHAVIRSMATINAATIRVAQLLGRRSRTLFAACNEKIKELVLSRDALSNEWTREKQLLEDACRYLKEKREKEAETLNSMEMVHQKLEGRVEHLETSRLQLERALREAQEALDSAENQRREKELALQRSNFTLEQTVAELQSSRTRVNELETREEELQQDADRLAGEISALQKTYNEEMEGLKEKLREQSSKLKSMDADKIRWRDELKAANDKVADLTTQMNAVKSQHTLKRQTQEKDLKASVTELSSLRETINDLKKTLKVEEETHKKEILAKTRIIQELRQRESKQTNELTALSHQLEIQKVGERAALESVLATLPSSVLITETKEKKGRQEASSSQKMGTTKEEVPIPGEAETVQDFRLRVLSGVQRTVNDLARVRAALDAWKDQQMRWSVSHQHTPGNEKKGVAETSHAPLRFEDDDDDDVGEISAIGVTSVSPSAAHTKRTCRQRFPSEQRMSSSNGNAMQDLNKCESTPFTIYHDVSPDKRGGVEVTSSFGISSSGSGGVAAAAASQQQGNFVDIPHSLLNGSPSHSSVAKTPNGMARLHSNPTTAGTEGGGVGSGLRSSPSRTNERIPFLHSVPLNRIGQRPSAPEGKQRSRQDSLRPMEGGATGEGSHSNINKKNSMSSRQLRRLQQLVSAYQEADELVMADEEEEGPSTQLRPSTASKRNALRRRRGGVKGTTVDDNTEMVTREDMKKEIEQEDQDPALVRSNSSSSSSSCASSGGSSRKSSSPVKEQSESAQSTSLPAMQGGGSANTTAAGKKKRKNKNNNNNARGNGAGNQKRQTKPSSPASHPSLSSSASPAPADSLSDPARDIVHRLMACDSSKLDTRLERLRNFGPQSLEEIGDGRTRARKKGEPRDTGSNSIFNEHPLARMPFCPLATPNSYRWPSFEPDGAHLSRTSEGKQNGVKHDIYALQVGEKFQIAESRRTMVTELNGDFMDLLNCLGFDFYHLPTLIALSHSFDLMNASYRSHEMADMALYRVGVLLMCSSFPLSETWREREAPMKVGMNKLILETLVVGYHHAMRRGCARSAFELSRLLLSLDRSDPYGALLMMDYAALRSKQWVWLLQLIQEARAVEAAVNSKKFSVANGKVIKDVSFRLTRLPGFAFTAAAAAFLLEKEGSHAVKREKSKVLMQLDRAKATLPCMKDLPSAVQLMRDAVLRFPITTECLMAELGIEMPVLFSTAGKALTIKERTCKAAAAQRAEAAMTGGPQKLLRLMEHFSKLFVARQIDFWRSSDLTDLLVSVLGQDESTAEEPVKKEVPNSEFCPDEDPSRDSVMTGISTCLASPQHALSLHALSHFNASAKLYMSIKVEDITGAVPVIPQEALNLEEEAEGRDAEDLESWDSNTTVDIQEVYPDPD